MDTQIMSEIGTDPEIPSASKFSRSERMYVKLERFIYWLASNNQNPDNVLMDFDEIVAELLLEFVKGLNHYESLPDNELELVLKRMFDHRIGELKYKYYSTHRKHAALTISIHVDEGEDDSENDLDDNNAPDVADLYDSAERVTKTKQRLSYNAKRVFNALIYGNNSLRRQLRLSTMRATHIFKTHRVKVENFHLVDALMLTESEVQEALAEIRRVYHEVCNE